MEFPDLGEHCSEKTCKRLDFLPMRCDACQEIFCKDHITYANHKCMSSYKKDIQVPVCPLCNIPIPIKRGEMPDIKVGEHIDRDCRSDPAQRKRKIFTNKCSKGGCKQKEMMRVTCDQCHLNFCLKHRHPLDHDCRPDGKPLSKSGWVALQPAALRSRRIWRSLRLSLPAKKSTDGSSRGNRYPESLSDTSMLTGRHRGTLLPRQPTPFEISLPAAVSDRGMGRSLQRGSGCFSSTYRAESPDRPTAAFLNLAHQRLHIWETHIRDQGGRNEGTCPAFPDTSTRELGLLFLRNSSVHILYTDLI
ncbi:unnamed protein product [Tetraodon nigroviridis]|uniref:(spotted green pufferfish) hypothetical protein n=1 Tax=Tetraodon nigroviridis TaxID=99883 RepID=Q4RHA1_TETNG|nr:unnamed protein product [Tetraodon nigroviridis]